MAVEPPENRSFSDTDTFYTSYEDVDPEVEISSDDGDSMKSLLQRRLTF